MTFMSNEWNVLLVDDEPDVLSVSKLAMRNFEVFGLPLKLHTAASKAETLEMLGEETLFLSSLAVAFIDVVMESDTAGLELCQYIREDLNNSTTQLFIRTGQPGIAPEREVIDRFDINGYFTKAEATEDKLYSLVKSGVRQYFSIRNMKGMMRMVDAFITMGDSRQKMKEVLEQILRGFSIHDWEKTGRMDAYADIGGQAVLGDIGLDKQEAMKLKEKLETEERIPLGPDGDNYIIDEKNNLLMNIVAKPYQPEAFLLFKEPPVAASNETVMIFHFPLRSMATIWARAK